MGSSGINSGVHGDCTPTQCPVTMLRPLLLLVPCLLALGWDMDDLHARGHLDRDIPGFDQEFEDMEDELENDFEEERSLNDDFDEHADDMEDTSFLLKLLHVGGGHRRAKELQQLYLRHVLVILIILHKQLNILDVLELDKFQCEILLTLQVFRGKLHILDGLKRLRLAEVQTSRLVLEDSDCPRAGG